MSKYIVVTGGGTGGHLSVAKALMIQLAQKGYKIIYVGSLKGQDRLWFENDSVIEEKYFLDTYGVVNQKGTAKIKSLWNILKSVNDVLKIFAEYGIEKVISVGGFSAASATFASIVARKKLYIHEQNASMGKLNQISSKFARVVFSSYDINCPIKDYPINDQFFQKSRVKTTVKTIIFLGGSQGAKAINDFALEVAPYLKEKNIKIIHQTGSSDFHRVSQKYKELQIDVEVFDFDTNLINKIEKADVAISRGGASTLWELCAMATPALFVPYPYAAGNHQYHNAKFLADQNMGFVCLQEKLNMKALEDLINCDIKSISEKLKKSIKPNGARSIVEFIEKD